MVKELGAPLIPIRSRSGQDLARSSGRRIVNPWLFNNNSTNPSYREVLMAGGILLAVVLDGDRIAATNAVAVMALMDAIATIVVAVGVEYHRPTLVDLEGR